MKRNTTDHPKLLTLARELAIPKYAAVGILESLWHWTARYAPAGDVGRYEDALLAESIGWTEDPTRLIDALVKCRWIDAHERHRLVIHDWADHCDDVVHMQLARAIEHFADGTMPKMSRLTKDEREKICDEYARKADEERAQSVSKTPCLAKPSPAQPGHARPSPPMPSHAMPSHAAPAPGESPLATASGVDDFITGGGNGREGRAEERMRRFHRQQQITNALHQIGANHDDALAIANRDDMTLDVVEEVIRDVKNDATVDRPVPVILKRLREGRRWPDGSWRIKRPRRSKAL